MTAYAEVADVRKVLQKHADDVKGTLGTEFIEASIHGVSEWFARQTNGHWFDSNLDSDIELRDTTANSASDVVLDVPASPHAQDRRIISPVRHAQYPVTVAGRYAEIPLAHLYVTSITKLEVRDRDGDVTDWVADSSFTEGRGEEYYLQSRGQNSYGRTYLYIDARQIGARVNFDRLLTLAYDYGLDAQTDGWDDVKRGIAALAAAQVVTDDDVLAQIPDSGQLIGVDTQHQQLVDIADSYLGEYVSAMGDNR